MACAETLLIIFPVVRGVSYGRRFVSKLGGGPFLLAPLPFRTLPPISFPPPLFLLSSFTLP